MHLFVQPQVTLDLGPPRKARSQCSYSKPQPGRNLDSPQIPSDDPQVVRLSDGRVWGSGRESFEQVGLPRSPYPRLFTRGPSSRRDCAASWSGGNLMCPSGAGGIMTIAIYSAQVAPEPQEQLALRILPPRRIPDAGGPRRATPQLRGDVAEPRAFARDLRCGCRWRQERFLPPPRQCAPAVRQRAAAPLLPLALAHRFHSSSWTGW